MSRKIFFMFVVLSLLIISNQVDAKQIDSEYFKGTITDKNGMKVDKLIFPAIPPKDFRMPVADPTDAAVTLSSVPAFDWSYGCSATSGAMMAGYYDNVSHPNMYAGPANGGVCPMTNAIWGAGESPLSATHMGYDGLGVNGHVDDYWVSSGSTSPDPYISNWLPHVNADCTGDFMGTNQSALGNIDGGTTFYFGNDGVALHDYTGCEPAEKDGCHGLREFFESRGYTVTSNYTQYIVELGLTYGFSLAQYQAEIDSGRPVLIQIDGHTMLGYGYDDSSSLIYVHDTWDYSSHTMTWGGSYSSMDHLGVTVFELAPTSGPPGAPSNPDPSHGAIDVDIDTFITWTNGYLTETVDLYFSDNQALVTNKDPSVLTSFATPITSTDPSGVWSLTNDTAYYWRIVCNNSSRASTDGPVWSFTTAGAPTIESVLSYYPDITYYMTVPNSYDMTKFGVYFTPADSCDLTKITAYFYGTLGSPTSCDLRIYDALDDGTGVEYPNNLLHTENVPIASIAAGWSEPEYTLTTPIHFDAGENFFIIYEIVGAQTVDEVWLLRSEGVTGGTEGTHSICEYGGAWNYHSDLWSVPFEMALDATVEYAGVIPPNFVINPAPVNFGQTAIGGWKEQVITLQNTGGGEVVVDGVSMIGDLQFELYDYNTYPDTLFSNESIDIVLYYGPDALVGNSAIVTVSETSSARTNHDIMISGEGYNHNSWASGTPMFDQPPTGNQGDNSWSMSTSDAAPGYLHAEYFWSLTESIEAVEFWGINWYHDGSSWVESDVEDPMDFEIKFYTDHATEYVPDTEVASFPLTLSRTTVDTVTFGSGPVYRYWADLPSPVALTDGWISIQGTSVSTPDDPWFLWSESPVGDIVDAAYDYEMSTWGYDNVDQAYALYAASTPPDPPVDLTITTIPNGTDVDVTLSWTTVPGATSYTVYRTHDPDSEFPGEWTAVTGIAGTSWNYTTDRTYRFYRVTATSGTRNTVLPEPAPVLKKKTSVIRSIKDSKLLNCSELLK